MRIFVYEWTCCNPSATASLRREGRAMLAALLDDFVRSGEVTPVTLIHEPFEPTPPGEVWRIWSPSEEKEQFRALTAKADATIIIAPETAGLLAERAAWVEEAGGQTLGSTPKAIALTGDKRQCSRWWRQCGVPTPRTWEMDEPSTYPAVLKPVDGAGSQATYFVDNDGQLPSCLEQAKSEGCSHNFILQEYAPGQAASIAFLIGPRTTIPLLPAKQRLSNDGRLRYLGGTLPIPAHLSDRTIALGQKAVESIPGLRGYVGVDIVLGDAADGGGDVAIEINPRLTTSYLGLRRLAQENLAVALLRVALGEDISPLHWRNEMVHFSADGSLESEPAFT